MKKEELYDILCCPETKQPVTEMSKEEVSKINKAIRDKSLVTVAGKVVKESIDTALIREDKSVAYPVRNSIPIMLIHEGFNPNI
jgi:uncharacterized protein YbaR (Trm112 family)